MNKHSDEGLPLLTGLIAAPYTPMHADGSLNLPVVEQQAARLVHDGVNGAFVCGTTGEGLSLTVDERMRVTQRWIDVAAGQLKIIVHVADLCQANACTLATHAVQKGAHAVAAMAPCFFKPATTADLVDWLVPVAAAADDLPFFFYHIPSMTGVALPMVELLEQAQQQIANFRGIKFTHNDLPEYQQCLNLMDRRFEIPFGRDEALLPALALGARAAVGSTYNYSAPVYQAMIRAFEANDLKTARRCGEAAVQFINVLIRHGGLRCGKAKMQLIGIDVGPPRSPIPPVGDEEMTQLRGELEQLGFFDWQAAGSGGLL